MQVESPLSARLTPQRTRAGVELLVARGDAQGVFSGATKADADATAASTAAQAAPVRAGLKTWIPQYNQDVAGAQQALSFLGDLAERLQGLRTALGSKLAQLSSDAEDGTAPAGEAAALDKLLGDFARRWRERPQSTMQSLDGNLSYGRRGHARQPFRVAGLDAKALQGGSRETLFFSVGGAGRQPIPVAIDPSVPLPEQVQRMDFALAPTGVRAALDGQGQLQFDVAETQWPSVRDSLAIQGGGVRYPAGQMHLARPETVPRAVRPETWSVHSRSAMRQTLQAVLEAQSRVYAAQQQVRAALSRAASQITPAVEGGEDDGTLGISAWVADFSAQFAQRGEQSGYQFVSAVAPALIGISRERVVALLGATIV
ncbi:hypothetical protein PY257_03185 [Ramlibacter sp. H39-3-26]|uniref:hypothetical protein n=1 Tax=Curvibacter soli TaxID=3031331 RepID=UPI0023D9975B|nr:hypothetical protein [Ramlibacter sp. H39-3-26]MDF1484192.1 hypothetical protein [Ramlibacter sp. H39-3-26]